MAWNSDKEISMEIEEGFDFILEEGQNTSINLRKISWNGRPSKLDIRKWNYTDSGERAMKGIGLSDEGADELAAVLVENGYGETRRLVKALKERNSDEEIDIELAPEEETEDDGEEEYYDPSELLG
jgi:hypothetical protein